MDDDVGGVWTGTATFSTDTVFAESNTRVRADYQSTFTFDLTYDDRLVSGTITETINGSFEYTQAGSSPQTYPLDGATRTFEVYGTYLDPVLELDVPDGPYEEGLWDFEVQGRRAESDHHIVYNFTLPLPDSTTMEFALPSDDVFDMERTQAAQGAGARARRAMPSWIRVAKGLPAVPAAD
ncbi:MAG TPA: hypothetical protein VD962_13070 [Rubricoccaceae bacterium]|nr:hypothetical protein [Rubricoccaceae bacterium]